MNDRKKPAILGIVTARRSADGEWTGHPDAVREAIVATTLARERARRWPQTPDGYVDTRAAMTVLARSFPVLARDATGIDPWDALPSDGSKWAAVERAVVLHAFALSGDNVSAVARLLGIHRRSFDGKLAKARRP